VGASSSDGASDPLPTPMTSTGERSRQNGIEPVFAVQRDARVDLGERRARRTKAAGEMLAWLTVEGQIQR